MYSITNVIVGIPITEELSKFVDQWEENDDPRWAEWEDFGFKTFYSGECGLFLRVEPDALFYHSSKKARKIPLTPNQTQLDEAHKLVQAVDPELVKLCPPFGVYFVMSTS